MNATPRLPDRSEVTAVLEQVTGAARRYLDGLDARAVRTADAGRVARSFRGPLPEEGLGATAALRELLERGEAALAHTSGPRCFHFVVGGTTPAALGADLWATVTDALAYAWVVSPLGVELERVAIGWLAELFALPEHRSGILTTGATMANFVGLAAARQWWGQRHGRDIALDGFGALPAMPVLTSGHVHASSVKALGMLGVGRSAVRRFARDAAGTLDEAALERALVALGGAPAVVIANAGEVNAGAFDPLERMADLAQRHGAWLHVDGAFGLFARVSPRTEHLARGAERADSICVDGHKWLNVPYDCGFALVRDRELLARSFVYDGAYLPRFDDDEPVLGTIGPESSRRARSFAVWATLAAYGRAGVRAMVERHLDLTERLARRVDEAPELERLAQGELCVACFRWHPEGVPDARLDELNRRLGQALLADGRYFVGTTTLAGRVALRPALVNWRIREEDVDGFVAWVREVAAGLLAETARR